MTILSATPVETDPTPHPTKPGYRANQPVREIKRKAVVNGMEVEYFGSAPTQQEVDDFVANRDSENNRINGFNNAIAGFSFGGQTLASLKTMNNAQFDAWWDANIDTLPKALTVLKLLTRAAIRRML